MNRRGPKQDPWGIPQVTVLALDSKQLSLQYCCLPSRYDLDQSPANSRIPYASNCSSKITWLKAHCRDADWINKTIKKKRIKQASVISLYSEIH